MKRVGVREFRDHATRYLAGSEVVAIARHGQTIGFYIPSVAAGQEDFVQAMERLERTVGQVLAETGLSEDELSRLFDPREPVPGGPSLHEEAAARSRASRR